MTANTVPVIAPDTYRIDPARSAVHCATKGMFGLITVRGTFTINSGTIMVAEDRVSSRVEATVDAASFQSGNKRRDADIASKRFLNAAVHPEITFSSTGVQREQSGGWSITGVLTVCGVSRDVTLPVAVSLTPDGIQFDTRTTIDRYAFGVTSSKGLVGRYSDIALRIRATPAR
jgi:polyisoprenoid-binding protein YceI